MKKLLALLLALAMIFALAACGETAPEAPATEAGGDKPVDTNPAPAPEGEKPADTAPAPAAKEGAK